MGGIFLKEKSNEKDRFILHVGRLNLSFNFNSNIFKKTAFFKQFFLFINKEFILHPSIIQFFTSMIEQLGLFSGSLLLFSEYTQLAFPFVLNV
jgi:hypothetical protein